MITNIEYIIFEMIPCAQKLIKISNIKLNNTITKIAGIKILSGKIVV